MTKKQRENIMAARRRGAARGWIIGLISLIFIVAFCVLMCHL